MRLQSALLVCRGSAGGAGVEIAMPSKASPQSELEHRRGERLISEIQQGSLSRLSSGALSAAKARGRERRESTSRLVASLIHGERQAALYISIS